MPELSEKDYWVLWQQFYPEIGPQRFYQLLDMFGSAKNAWKAPLNSFQKLGWQAKTIEKLKLRNKSLVTVTNDWYNKNKINLITREESRYPSGLNFLAAPPPLLGLDFEDYQEWSR